MAKRDGIYSSIDDNGNIHYGGPLEATKGNHDNMTPRTEAYLPDANEPQVGMYDRGHVTASSLSPHATNDKTNVTPMHSDLNRAGGAYYAMEDGQRTALSNGASIHSEKTAFVNGQPGEKPSAFLVSDTITYENGHVDHVHLSFANASYAEQQAWNDMSASLPGTFDAPNPGDGLRGSMDSESYASIMESTDAELRGLAAEYASADFSGVPDSTDAASASADIGVGDDTGSGGCSADSGGDAGSADAGDADAGGGDGGVSADAD